MTPPRVDSRAFAAAVRRWLRRFGASPLWRVKVVVCRTPDAADEDMRECVAWTTVDDGYYMATVYLNAYLWTAKTDVAEVAAHEAVHVLLWRFAQFAKAAAGDRLLEVVRAEEEDFVEAVGRALVVLERGRRPARREEKKYVLTERGRRITRELALAV